MRRTFDRHNSSAAAARAFVADAVAGRCSEEVLDAVVLLTSELVSNSLLHTASAPTVEVTFSDDMLRVSVLDGSPVIPVQKRYGAEATTGRGMLLVETLAARWGAERADGGKCVWFDLRLDRVGSDRRGALDELGSIVDEGATDLDALAAAFGEVDIEGDDHRLGQWRQVIEQVPVLVGVGGR